MLSALGYHGLRVSGIPALHRRLRAGGVVLCYHNVVRERHATPLGDPGLHLPADRFAAQLRWLARHYTVVPLGELVARMAGGRSLRGLAVLTFDDGYAGLFEHALPVLRELRLPATVFVVPAAIATREPFWWDHPAAVAAASREARRAWLGPLRGDQATILDAIGATPASSIAPSFRPASWSTLLAATMEGVEIGAHSLAHRALPTLSATELRRDLAECRDLIAARVGKVPEHFAYPYGLWDERVARAVREAGFRAAVTLERGANTARTDLWQIRRVNIAAGIDQAAFTCWVDGIPLGSAQ